MDLATNWEHSRTDIFWGEIADCKHIVQIYESDEAFIEAVAGFVITGVDIEDCSVVIATPSHLKMLNEYLASRGLDVEELVAANKYLTYDAEDLLKKNIIDGNFDQVGFNEAAGKIVAEARDTRRMIRMFGETSALLWSWGYKIAALNLEHIGNKFCQQEAICLFCAYSKEGLAPEQPFSIDDICAEHSKLISGSALQLNEVYYCDTIVA